MDLISRNFFPEFPSLPLFCTPGVHETPGCGKLWLKCAGRVLPGVLGAFNRDQAPRLLGSMESHDETIALLPPLGAEDFFMEFLCLPSPWVTSAVLSLWQRLLLSYLPTS